MIKNVILSLLLVVTPVAAQNITEQPEPSGGIISHTPGPNNKTSIPQNCKSVPDGDGVIETCECPTCGQAEPERICQQFKNPYGDSFAMFCGPDLSKGVPPEMVITTPDGKELQCKVTKDFNESSLVLPNGTNMSCIYQGKAFIPDAAPPALPHTQEQHPPETEVTDPSRRTI